jgi:serine/threonine-protein kinase
MIDITGHDFGRYSIVEKAGEGGMAIVYKAYDKRLENHIALKIIRIDRLTPELAKKSLMRFEREAKSLAQLGHPNIIKVLDYGEVNGSPFIVMEYLPGGTLKDRLPSQAISWQDAVNFLLPIAHALDFAHQRGMIHRDVKPSNILFNQAKQPVLSDFGIVKLLGDEVTRDLSSTSVMIGTPEYMSPEQAMGAAFDHRVDIYALGIIFYEMITGRKPFKADTPIGVLVKQASEPLPRPSQFNKNLPQNVENVLLKALLKDPRQRYQNMSELISALNGLLINEGKTASTYGRTPLKYETVTENLQTANRHTSVKKWLIGLLIGGAALVLLCLAGLTVGKLLGIFPAQPTNIMFTSTKISASATRIPTSNSAEIITSTLPASTDTQQPTLTPIPTKTSTATMIVPSCQLESCDNSSEDVCVFGISPQPSELIISFKFKQELSLSSLPQLLVGGQKYNCDVLIGYPGRLFCNGATVVGKKELVLVSSTNNALCSGTFNIPAYVEPVPTKKNSGGNRYP